MIPFEFERDKKLVNPIFLVLIEKGHKTKIIDFFMATSEVYWKPTQTFKMQLFAKMVNDFQLTVFLWLFSQNVHFRYFPRLVCPHPHPFCSGGLSFLLNFQKCGLDKTSNLIGRLLGKREWFFSGDSGRGCNFHIKNKLKSKIFNDKKSL